MNSLNGSDTGGVFGGRPGHYQHQIPQLKKDKVKAQRKSGRRPGTGQQEARQVQQPQIPTERETETGCHRGRCQQTPHLPVIPAKDWPLPHRTILPVDDHARARNAGGASTASRPVNICSRAAPSGCASRNPSGQPSWRRPRSSQAPLGGGAVPKLRSCSPMSGAAKRSSIFSQPQTSEGRQAHR